MQAIFNIINKPLGWLLETLAGFFGGNFAVGVFLFTLLINIILIPLSIKGQKSSVQQTRIKPKLDELKKRYGDDKQKYSQAMQDLYREENISAGGGCLPMILRLVLMMSIYYLIMQPLTYLMHIDSAVISEAAEALGVASSRVSELQIIGAVESGAIDFPQIAEKLGTVDFTFLGMNLTETPVFSFDIFHDAQRIWLMPLIAFAAQMLTSVLSMQSQKKINPNAPNMTGMMLTMPLFTLFIGFSLPGGVAFYWACSSLIGGLIQLGIQNFYGPHKMISRERSNDLKKQCEFEELRMKKAINTQDNE